MKLRSMMALLLALLLVMSSCVAFAEDDVDTPYGKYPEKVTITFAKKSSPKPNLLEGDTADNNPMTRYITDKINVDFKLLWEEVEDDFANKLALNIQDLPDMFTLSGNDYLMFKHLLDNDMLEPLDEVYEKYASDTVKMRFSGYEGRNFEPFRGEDGHLYGLGGGRYGYEHNQLWARTDWLEAAGLEMPQTIKDIENVLQYFKDNPPSENYVGMILNATSIGGVYDAMSASPLFAAFHAYPNMWVLDENGKAVWGSVQPQVKEGLAILADWYQKGLIDPEFPTRIAGGANEALISGSATGLFFFPWYLGFSCPDFNDLNPDATLDNTNAPLDSDGKFNIAFPGATDCVLCVRKGYEHPEAIIKAYNCEVDAWRGYDAEGAALLQPTRDNGCDWEYLVPTTHFNGVPVDEVPRCGLVAHAIVNGEDYEQYHAEQITITWGQQAKEFVEKGNDAAPGCWQAYIARYVGADPELMYADNLEGVYPAFSFVTEGMADLKPNLDALEQTTFLKIVTGELPVDAFDQFVSDWYAQGGQMMTDEVNAEIAR